MYVSPPGNTSEITTLEVLSGPEFVTETVKVTFWPTLGVIVDATCVTDKSASNTKPKSTVLLKLPLNPGSVPEIRLITPEEMYA